MSRVVSKHLFNYHLNGIVDDDVLTFERFMEGIFRENPDFYALKQSTDSENTDADFDAARYVRQSIMLMTSNASLIYKKCIEYCIHSEFRVPPIEGNNSEVPVLVHTPVSIAKADNNAAIIYAHGGGVVGGEASMFKGMLSNLAIENGVVYFNVDYRIAPETKFPKNTLDFYCAVKYIVENADNLGIDSSRIAIAGDSGGGYLCFTTMVMLAQRNEGTLIKLAIPSVPMLDDYCFSDLASMTREERLASNMMRKVWRLIANDLDKERNNPLLFPAKASDEILKKMPPTIIWGNEFDSCITEVTRMAYRMRKVGRLLEFRVQPGMTHMAAIIHGLKGYKENIQDYKLAIKEYLL